MILARFEWSEAKNRANLKKHGVSFETAIRIFADPFALSEQDRVEGNEQRWLAIGTVESHLILVVAHTIEEHGDDGNEIEIIRIISARKADRTERRQYENG